MTSCCDIHKVDMPVGWIHDYWEAVKGMRWGMMGGSRGWEHDLALPASCISFLHLLSFIKLPVLHRYSLLPGRMNLLKP